MRDIKFLEDTLYDLWENHFCDVPRHNLVLIKYGKFSKRQLGSIKIANTRTRIKSILKEKKDDFLVQDHKSITVITMTKYFQSETVPEFVVRAVIAHELCHYAHGFSSPLEKRFDKPHQGGIVKKELEKRGLLEEQERADRWIKKYWKEIISEG
ncbi:MAG: hypothetical protein WCY00_02500 [Candidatus Dojkabacteria bacterium]